MKTIFGLTGIETNVFFWQIISFFQKLNTLNWITLAIGSTTILILSMQNLLKKKWKWMGFVPVALILILFSTLLSFTTKFYLKGVQILGKVPSGLPPLSIPSFSISNWQDMIITSLVLALVGYLENISIGTKIANYNRYELNPNQELIALGMSNLVGAFFSSSIPTTGSFSRTAGLNFFIFLFFYFFIHFFFL